MKQFIYLSAICIISLSACTGAFKKSDNGLEYKIISSGSGKTIGYGNFMQIHIKQVYGGTKDSILMNTHDGMPRIQILDSVSTPIAYFKILIQMKKGDSLVLRLLSDSAFKNSPSEMPPFMQKGKYLYTHVSLLNIFETKEQADSANAAEIIIAKPKMYKKQMVEIEKMLLSKKDQLVMDKKIINDYLLKNNIKATPNKWGTYVAINAAGTGEKINNNSIVVVNYTGKTLDSSRVFDSNIDPKFNHVQPYSVNMMEIGSVILGWTDALMQLQKGTKATIYIPSVLAYGASGNGSEIKPNENLIFDIEVIDVTTEEAYAAKQKAMQEEMMDKMKQGQNLDSTQKKADK